MTEKPETISESLRRMDIATVRRIILEAEAYLEEQTYTSILAVLKAGIGLGLSCEVLTSQDAFDLQVLATTVPKHPAGWKSLGKFIATSGSLMSKAGIGIHVLLENTPNFEGGACAVTIKAFPPSFSFLKDAEAEDKVSAQDVLAFLNPPDDN